MNFQKPSYITFLSLWCVFFVLGSLLGCNVEDQEPVIEEPVVEESVVEQPPPPPAGMVLIPAGEFDMGSNDGPRDEQPVHKVYTDAFYMDETEVTNLNFKRFVLANPQWQKTRIPEALHNGHYLADWDENSYPVGEANHPVVSVSWYAAMAYAEWAGKRLPTEAEWEKAARGGKVDQGFPWENGIDSSKANYGENIGSTTTVGRYLRNAYGLYDMAGNVWEWCLDAYDENFYFSSPVRNPLSDVNTIGNLDLIVNDYTKIKSYRVFRGGSWTSDPVELLCSYRSFLAPEQTLLDVGFRCVRDVTY